MRTTSLFRCIACTVIVVLSATSTLLAINTFGYTNRTNFRGGNTPVVVRANHYDLQPSVMLDYDGKYKMWYAGQKTGSSGSSIKDHIFYTEATALSGPWSTPVKVFEGTNNAFDEDLIADPSVIRVEGTYYMYYTGSSNNVCSSGDIGYIGLATSTNGTNWTRQNGGQPIIVPHNPPPLQNLPILNCPYTAGQPSVNFVDGWFYILFHDNTGADQARRAYVMRSRSPVFTGATTEQFGLVGGQLGFHAYNAATRTDRGIRDLISPELTFHDGLQQFVVFFDGVPGETLAFFFSKDFATEYGYTDIPGDWIDGPGAVRQPNGHLHRYPLTNQFAASCIVPLDVYRTVGTHGNGTTYDIAHTGMDLTLASRCGDQILDVPLAYDKDAHSDPIVYRQTSGVFFVRNSDTATTSLTLQPGPNSVPITGDFDGDGRADYGIVTNVSNTYTWSIKHANPSTPDIYLPLFGVPGATIVIGDYNGNGKDDLALYYPNGNWNFRYDNGTFSGAGFGGAANDIPVPADYDGDGITDQALVRQNAGQLEWRILRSSLGFVSEFWGTYTQNYSDIPLTGDFFPDGKADLIVYNPVTGDWSARPLGSATTELRQWGLPAHKPLLADFNGDGRLDLVAHDVTNTGDWYINFRNGQTQTIQWGLSYLGDRAPIRIGLGPP